MYIGQSFFFSFFFYFLATLWGMWDLNSCLIVIVPPEIELVPLAVEVQSFLELSAWEVPGQSFLKTIFNDGM